MKVISMKVISIRIFLILSLLILINPYSLPAATEQRIALVIGNGTYSSCPLKNPVNDATDMATALKRAGFTVTLKKNANLQEMVEAIENFGNNLKRGGVGLFYYAGHGVQVSNVNYLLPVSAKINKESDVRFQAVDAGRVLAEMENANNGLNIVILDACRDNPFGKSFRSSSRGLAIVANAPSGTFISYSTGAGQVASDGEGKNSPYTRALLENIAKPGLTINKVFMNVRSKVKKETGQVPWELSSLEGDFYFMTGSAKMVSDKSESVAAKTSPTDDLDDENKKLEAEQRRLEEEKASFVKKKALDEKRQQIEEERERLEAEKEAARQVEVERKQAKKTTTLAMSKRPLASTVDETTGMQLVFVKGGCFQMGDNFGDGDGDEKPVHDVCVSNFYIGKYEVTQGQWEKVMGSNPSHFKNCGENCPVENVSWNDTQDFIRKLNSQSGKNYRLPTEAEWEYAARSGGRKEKYSGTDSSLDDYAWYSSNSGSKTHTVGQMKPNGLGIYDMSGNVWEWCSDGYWFKYYGESPRDNPQAPDGSSYRVLRGGGWEASARSSCAASRNRSIPVIRNNNYGFRIGVSPR